MTVDAGHYVFELAGAMHRSMVCKYAFARAVTDFATFGIGEMKQDVGDVVLLAGKENLLAGREKFVETFPVIGQNRSSTRRCFKQPDRRRVAGSDHVLACEI